MQADTATTIAASTERPRQVLPIRWSVFGISLLLGLAGNFLLFGHVPGVALPAFLTLVAFAAALACRRSDLENGRKLALGCLALLLALIPLLENVSPLSVVIGLCGLSLFVLTITGSLVRSFTANALRATGLTISGPFSFTLALVNAGRSLAASPRPSRFQWTGWLLPVGMGSLFVYLFQSANPIIEQWLSRFNLLAWMAEINVAQVMFCIAMMALTWPFLQGRLAESRFVWFRRPGKTAQSSGPIKTRASGFSGLFSHAAIVRSLVLFNALFAVQTSLDVAYLWGGRALPDGMSFASYAHRGAYPLVATALIAAIFTLITLRRGSETENSRPVRNLVLLWTGQNVLLVASSIFRLDLYVSVYSLTLLRLEAFVWMSLVAVGLVLIMLRIVFNHGNAWLVRWNLVSLALTLYACSLVNFPAVIANYNVDHSLEVSGKGVPLDVRYLFDLGPQVIPALDRYARLHSAASRTNRPYYISRRSALERQFYRNTGNWRSWTFQNQRLKKYLRNKHQTQP